LAAILLADPKKGWPGYAEAHSDTLDEAAVNPKVKYDEVYSGCDNLDRVNQYKSNAGVSSFNYSYWSDEEIMVPVSGTAGAQTVPVGVTALGGGSPYDKTTYLYSPQLKRPVGMLYARTMRVGEDGGVEANRFEITSEELSPGGLADIPGLEGVGKAALGVGQLTCKRKSTCLQEFQDQVLYAGVVDVTPANGFAAYVSRPHFDGAAHVFTENVTLVSNSRLASLDHLTYLAVEPASGKTILGHERLQLSSGVMFAPELFYPNLGENQNRLVPQYWLDEYASATPHDIDTLTAVISLYQGAMWSLYIGPALGALILAVGLYYACGGYHVCCVDDGFEAVDVLPYGSSSSEDDNERRASLLQSRHDKSMEEGESCGSRISGAVRGSFKGSFQEAFGAQGIPDVRP
jgi:hypothetical protein